MLFPRMDVNKSFNGSMLAQVVDMGILAVDEMFRNIVLMKRKAQICHITRFCSNTQKLFAHSETGTPGDFFSWTTNAVESTTDTHGIKRMAYGRKVCTVQMAVWN
ncbi:hypothetical protein DYB37_012911 [Aphanomyces astaci]|uniref:Uncharacterized protein n=1 Tax=Aphanomyces astaci TaxID=112090 RepID=A0A3R7B9X4_APHAT|nr:hypothetical protein DYB35_008044 [Aphanomyces astaci]RHZ33097.1 hypothetical protein DYB37_012911 [Aphanomyces astaci]